MVPVLSPKNKRSHSSCRLSLWRGLVNSRYLQTHQASAFPCNHLQASQLVTWVQDWGQLRKKRQPKQQTMPPPDVLNAWWQGAVICVCWTSSSSVARVILFQRSLPNSSVAPCYVTAGRPDKSAVALAAVHNVQGHLLTRVTSCSCPFQQSCSNIRIRLEKQEFVCL
jgi:hypothetical protein